MKCKGCAGEITYTLAAEVPKPDYYSSGPALKHTLPHCEWFKNTPTVQIIAHITDCTVKDRAATTFGAQGTLDFLLS